MSNKEIAKNLSITPETVKSHVKHIFTKLGVEKRAQAAVRAQSLGLVIHQFRHCGRPIRLTVRRTQANVSRRLAILGWCDKITAGRTAVALRGARKALSAEFQFGSSTPELTDGAAFDGRRVVGRRLSIDRSRDGHAAVEAMGSVEAVPRDLLISTERTTPASLWQCNSGPGIDPSHLERVFDAFHTTKSSGTGMGLSICRSIIDAHGGRLWAEANEPRGTIFQFTLPAVP